MSNKLSGRKIGLIAGVNDWTKRLSRHWKKAKRVISKKVRKNFRKIDYENEV